MWYTLGMKDKGFLKQIASWPEADQQEIAEVAREIESRRKGLSSGACRILKKERVVAQHTDVDVTLAPYISSVSVRALGEDLYVPRVQSRAGFDSIANH